LSDALLEGRNLLPLHARCVEQNFMFLSFQVSSRTLTPPPLVGEVGCLECLEHVLAAARAALFTPRFSRLLHLDVFNVAGATRRRDWFVFHSASRVSAFSFFPRLKFRAVAAHKKRGLTQLIRRPLSGPSKTTSPPGPGTMAAAGAATSPAPSTPPLDFRNGPGVSLQTYSFVFTFHFCFPM
jgi:hypothetical protein